MISLRIALTIVLASFTLSSAARAATCSVRPRSSEFLPQGANCQDIRASAPAAAPLAPSRMYNSSNGCDLAWFTLDLLRVAECCPQLSGLFVVGMSHYFVILAWLIAELRFIQAS